MSLNNLIRHALLDAPRLLKQGLAVACDVWLCVCASSIAMGLRTDVWTIWGAAHERMTWVGVPTAVILFVRLGLYRAIFRYAGLAMVQTIIKALIVYCIVFVALFTFVTVEDVPRSMGLLHPVVFGCGVIASRLFVRRWLGGGGMRRQRRSVSRALIYGAGSAGRQLAMGMSQAVEVLVVGYVDDDPLLHGRILNGLPIFAPADLPTETAQLGVSQIFLALPSVSRRRRREIIESLMPLRLQVRILPGLMDLTHGRVEISDLKELDIEDLLGRDPVPADAQLIAKNIADKVVMVTGAGGSIGSELCRQILMASPKTLLLIDASEYALYIIEQELAQLQPSRADARLKVIPLLADVRNQKRMAEIMTTWHPQTVYHAAAYKHVPLVEHNPAEGLRNNLQGTWVMVEQAITHGVKDFVLISTDKAVRPTNIMGASKRLAEMVLQALADPMSREATDMRMSIVRFGNVLGSSGSVVPLFKQQIRQGGPITLTDARITRYFMTIPEAAQLVIQACAMATGGDVFVLDMGESVKIIELVHKMVELSGLSVMNEANPEGDIAIRLTGLRPGEKLYEELLIGDNPLPTSHPRILKAHEGFLPWDVLRPQLQLLGHALEDNNVPQIRNLLQTLVPDYQPESDVVDWVYLARQETDHIRVDN